MKKSKLVDELRGYLLNWEGMTPAVVALMRDPEIIEKFTTCCDCGVPLVNRRERKAALKKARSVPEFFKLCKLEHHPEDGDGPSRLGHGHPALN